VRRGGVAVSTPWMSGGRGGGGELGGWAGVGCGFSHSGCESILLTAQINGS